MISEIGSPTKRRELLPGVIRFLKRLKEAKVPCALISNDTEKGIKSFLKENDLQELVQESWSANHQPPKPHPNAVEQLCKICITIMLITLA